MVASSAALAFGAVYPWGLIPLLVAAGCLGIAGLARTRRCVLPHLTALAIALASVCIAVGFQLVPLSPAVVAALSPNLPSLVSVLSLSFRGSRSLQTSIVPAATRTAFLSLVAFSIYVIGAPALMSRRSVRQFPRLLLAFAVPLAFLGIFSAQFNNGLVLWFWKPIEGSQNAFGPFVNRNHFAGWMVMAISLGLGLWCGRFERLRRTAGSTPRASLMLFSTREANVLILLGLGLAVMSASVIWTLSRSGILSFGLVILCFTWLVATRPHVGRSWRLAVVVALATLAVAGFAWRGVDRLAARYRDVGDLQNRFGAWQDGWRVVRDYPLVGTGLNTFDTAMLFYQRSNERYHLGSAHNDYLQILAEGGLLVAVPATMVVFTLILAIRRNVKAAHAEVRGYWIRAGAAVGLTAVAVQELVEFSLQIPANAFLACTLAAIALAPHHHVD